MLEKFISAILVPYLSKYAENIDSKQLNVDLWNGKATLKDLILKPNVLDSLLQSGAGSSGANVDNTSSSSNIGGYCGASSGSPTHRRLPLTLQRGICREVNISIPFRQLRSKPVVVEVGELFICLRGNMERSGERLDKGARLDVVAAKKERELELFEAERQRQKEMAAAAAEGQADGAPGGGNDGSNPSQGGGDSSKAKGGYFSRLGELVVNNIVFKARSIHIRYEDESTQTVLGAILGGVHLLTINNSTGEAAFVDPTGLKQTHKRLEFSGMQIYCNNPERYEMHPSGYFISQIGDMSSWCTAMRRRVEEGDVDMSTILGPVKGHVDMNLVFKEFVQELLHEPYLAVKMNLDSVIAKINRSQYVSLMRTVSLLTNWTEVNTELNTVLIKALARRPSVSVKGHAGVWWSYVKRVFRALADSPRQDRRLQRLSEVCMMDYQVIYRDVVRKAEMSPEKQRAYRFITRFMTVSDMITGRKYVYTQIANEIHLKRKDIEAKKTEAQSSTTHKKTGWLGWLRRGSSTPQDVQEEELAFEELELSYGLDPNNPDEISTEIVDVAHLPASYCWLDVQFDLRALTIHANLSNTETVTLMLHHLTTQFFRYNTQDSMHFDFITRNLTLSNSIDHDLLLTRLPSRGEGLRREETSEDMPLLSCSVAIKPVEQPLHDINLDFVMVVRLLPLRVVADASTIDCLVRFFEFPNGIDLVAIVDRTKEIAAGLGSMASEEVRLAMGRLKSMKVNVDVAAPYIILPKRLRSSPDEPALTISLGHVQFDTQPLTETEKQSRLAASSIDVVNEDLLYYSSTATFADFYMGLAPLGEALERRDAGFMLLPEVAFSAEVLQRIDSYADNRERFIIRMEVPTLRVACSVSQAFVLSSLAEQWLLYLHAPGEDDVHVTSPFSGSLDMPHISQDLSGSRNATTAAVTGNMLDSTFSLSRTRRTEPELEEQSLTSINVGGKSMREDLPLVRLHVAVREMGIVIYEDDPVTQQPLSTPRFTLAFRTSTFTLHVQTLQRRLEMLLDQPYCQDVRDPDHLILSGFAICCDVLTAPDKPIYMDVHVKPSLRFRLGTPCIQLLESIMDIVNLITTAPAAAAATAAVTAEGPDKITALHVPSLRRTNPELTGGVCMTGTETNDQTHQKKLVEQLRAMPDSRIARLNLRISGTSTVELMNYRPGVDTEDYLFAYVSFAEVSLRIKKNRVTFELNGGVDQVTVALSDAHQVTPANRVVLEYRAPSLSPESSAKKYSPPPPLGQEENDQGDLEKSTLPSHRHVSFAYRTSRPVMPIFVVDTTNKRHLENASELRFSSFVEVEIGSSAVLLDMHSIMTLAEYFSTGFFAGVAQVANRPRYDGRVINLSARPAPPPLLMSVRVYARDLAFVLPIDARTDSGHFQVSVDHVAVQSNLLSAEGQQAINISLREIRMLRSGPSGRGKDVDLDPLQDAMPRTPTSSNMMNILMPTTTLDVSVKSPLDPLSEDPLRVDLKGDDLSLAITEGDLVELCQLASGNLTRFPTRGTSSATAPPASTRIAKTPPLPPRTTASSAPEVLSPLGMTGLKAFNNEEVNAGGAREVHIHWCASNVTVSFLDNRARNQRFRLIGNAFSFHMVAPNNRLVVSWNSLELLDAQEGATQHATMLLCGASRVDLRNVLTTRDIMEKNFGVRPIALNSTEAVIEPTDSEISFTETALFAPKTEFLEVTTLTIDFTLRRFAISDQWLAVYDFVCNESVMRALQPMMAPRATSPTDAIPVPGVKDTPPQGSFRCLVTTRTVSILFLTSTQEAFVDADVNSLFVDVIQIANTTNVTVRMRDLSVRHCDSGERILFKRSEQTDPAVDDDLYNMTDMPATLSAPNNKPITSGFTASGAATSAATATPTVPVGPNTVNPTLSSTAAAAAAGGGGGGALTPGAAAGGAGGGGAGGGALAAAAAALSSGGKTGNVAEDDILTVSFTLDSGSERQKMTIALGQLNVLCAFPLLMRLVEYCTGPDQPIAKISNLGVMRERREWLARAAVNMVDRRAFSLHLHWQQPCIILAGDALELSNKSRNIKAQLGVMRTTVHLDKRQGSCTVSTKINDFAIPDMLEKSVLHFSYTMKDRREVISVNLEKTTALLHPDGVEKLLWVLQRNFLMPYNGTTQATNTQLSEEKTQQQEQQQEQQSPLPQLEAGTQTIPRVVRFEAVGLVIALHDVVGINVHTASLNELNVEMAPGGDVTLTLRSFSVVEHYTNKQLMHSTSASDAHCLHLVHRVSDKTMYVRLTDVNFVLLPRALGSLFNVLLSLQFPPPLASTKESQRRNSCPHSLENIGGQSRPQQQQEQQEEQLRQQSAATIEKDKDAIPTNSDNSVALVSSVRVSLQKCCTTVVLGVREICTVDVIGATVERSTYNDGTNTLTAVVPWVVVKDLISPNTRYNEIVKPQGGRDATTSVAEFSYKTLPLHTPIGISTNTEMELPTYTHRLQCRIVSFTFVFIPEVTFAVMRALSDVKEHISDVNREKAYDYVADKTAQTVQERQDLTQVEVVLNCPSIILVDTASTNRTVEVFPGDLVIRNELTNPNTEVFSLSLDCVSLNVLGASAFQHSDTIQVELSRSLVDTAAGMGSTTVKVDIPRLSADVSQDQLSCLLDVMGALQHAGPLPVATEPFMRPTPPTSQLGTHEAGSVASGVLTNTASTQAAIPVMLRKRQPSAALLSGHSSANVLPITDAMPLIVTPGATTSPTGPGSQLNVTATMQRLEVNIDDYFRVEVDDLNVAYSTTPAEMASMMNMELKMILLRHRVTGDNGGSTIFIMRDAVLVSNSITKCVSNSRLVEVITDMKVDTLRVALSPLMLIDTRELLYGPFCMKVLRVPLQPIPVCCLSNEVFTLDADLLLDSNHVLVTANKARCLYELDLNQHRLSLSGAPSAQIVIDDGCHLTITNGTIVVPGAYSLSSFVSFGLNAALFTTPSCIVEKQLHHERGLPVWSRGRASRHRSRAYMESSNASHSKNTSSPNLYQSIQQPQQGGLLSPPPPPPLVSVMEERLRTIAKLQCSDMCLRLMDDEVEELGITLLMKTRVTYSQETEGGLLTQRGGTLRLDELRTGEHDETRLLPTHLEVSIAGVNKVSMAISINALEMCLRVALVRSTVELGKDFLTAFIEESTVQRHAPQVVLEDEQLRPLVNVSTYGECRSCDGTHALLGECADAPGVLCYRCCTGHDTRSATEIRFELQLVNLVLIGDGGGMLRVHSPNALLLHLSLSNNLQLNARFFVHNLNPGASVWEPLVEHFEASAGGEISESSYWLKIERFDYVISPGNLRILSQIATDFSATSTFQKQLPKRSRQKVITRNIGRTTHETAAVQHVDTTTSGMLTPSLKCPDQEVPYAFVHVQNYLNDTLEVDGKEVMPRGGLLEFETMNRTIVARRGFSTGTGNDLQIHLNKSPLCLRALGLLVNIHIELLRAEGSHHLQRVVRLSCYPVHYTNTIICFENNLTYFVEVWHGVPLVRPGERFYFQPNFSLNEKLQVRPVRTPEGEEYAAAVTASSGVAPTLQELLNNSCITLICSGTKNPKRRFIIKIVERQEEFHAGIPTVVLSIQPELLLENCLPCSIFITMFLKTKDEKRPGQGQKEPLYTNVVESQKTADVFLPYVILEDVRALIELRQGDEKHVVYQTKKGVSILKRKTTVFLYGTREGTPEMRLNVHHIGHRVVFTSSYTISNFTPLPLRIRECKPSGELSSKTATNFEILPKNMQQAYAAYSRISDSEFFVNVSCGDHTAFAVPFHVQSRGLIILRVKKPSSTLTSSSQRPIANSLDNSDGTEFHLVYLTQLDMFGTLAITIVPRWVLVNRTPRPLFVVPATTVYCATKSPSSSASSASASEKAGQYPSRFSSRADLAQLVPANTTTPFFVTPKCPAEVGYRAFVLQSKDAAVRGDPVSLEEISNAMVIAPGARSKSVTAVETDIIIETSVVVDGAYTFLTLQDPLVPPTILLNRTNKFLEIFDAEGRVLSRASPGSILPLLIDGNASNRRTRVCLAKDPTVTPAEVSLPATGAEESKTGTLCVEFDFFQSMIPGEVSNLLEIEYKVSFGSFGQRTVELLPTHGSMEKGTCAYRCAPPAPFKCAFNMSMFTVSIVRENSDILFAAIIDTRVQYNRQGVKEVVEFSIKNVQADNQSDVKPVFEVCLTTVRPSGDAHCISGYLERTVVPAKALLYVNEVRLDVMPLVIRISDKVLIAVMGFIRQLFKEVPLRQTAPTDSELFDMAPLQVGAMNTRVIMERMVVNPLTIRLWFEREDEDFIREEMRIRTALLLSMMVRSCADVRIETPGMLTQNRTAMAGVMLQWIMQVYLDNLRSQIGGLLFQYASSLPLLGAPIKLVSGVTNGVMKFFGEPIAGLSTSSKAFALGLVSGSTGLAAEVVGGSLGAVSNLAKTGADILSLGVSNRERRKTNILRGIASGVTGIVTKPMEGAAESGAVGLAKGVGYGIIGLVASPVAGLFSDVSKAMGTAAQFCDDSHLPKVKRMRKLRDFHANGAVAEYQSLISIYEYDRGEYRDSHWVRDTFIPTDGPAWVPFSKEQALQERALPLTSWRMDRFDTNFEGWTFSNKYHGVYTRAQVPSVRVRRRRWVAQVKRPVENRFALLVQVEGEAAEPKKEVATPTTVAPTEAAEAAAEAEAEAMPQKFLPPLSAAAPGPAPSPLRMDMSSPCLSAAPHQAQPSGEEDFVVELYEHESKKALFGWSSRFLPSGYSAWQTPKGVTALHKSAMRPPEGWVWMSEWTTVGGDADGWEYILRDNKGGAPTLRRRHWRRSMKRVG